MASPPSTQSTEALQSAALQSSDMSVSKPRGDLTEPAVEAMDISGPSTSNARLEDAAGRTSRALPAGVYKPPQARQSAQRARQRSRARTEGIEAQAAQAEADLQELEASQKELEDRNALLESMTRLSMGAYQGVQQQSSTEGQPSQSQGVAEYVDLITIAADAQDTVQLTVLGEQQEPKTAANVATMSYEEFAMLYAEYAHKIEHCLAEASQQPSSPAAALLRKWTCELSSLRVFLALGHLKKYLSFCSVRLDGTAGPSAPQLTDAWYHELLDALQLTSAQQRDVLQLRRLFYGKLGALGRERRALLTQVPSGAAETAASISNQLGQFAEAAGALQDNSDAELKTYMQFLSAFGRGILTIKQQATGIVKGFPYIPEQPRLIEVLAALHNEQPIMVLTQAAGLDNWQHHASWQTVNSYLGSVTAANLHLHVPFLAG